LAAVALALATGCSPKSDSTPVSVPVPHQGVAATSAPVMPYKFVTPTTEKDLQTNSAYGYLIAKTRPDFNVGLFSSLGLSVKGKFTLKGYNYYRLFKDSDVLPALTALQVTSGVLFAEPDQAIHLDAALAYTNPDPLAVSEEWSMYTTKLKDAWTTFGFGPNRPVVADLDTGINWKHEDMQVDATTHIVKHAYSWWDLSGATPTGSSDIIDYIDTAVTSTANPADPEEAHGCHTAGIIAAQGNNGLGMAGVCWQADLFSYKVFSGKSSSSWSIYGSLYHLLSWKQANKYNHTIPVNMSLGGPSASAFEVDIIEACEENNILVIASTGNSGESMASYPGAYQGVIGVGATNGQDHKVHFSTSGPQTSVVAPGYDIISCSNSDNHAYESMSGTSMAAPFVTGLVTYMLTFNPDLTPAQIKTYLEQNTDYIDGATGYSEDTGWGRVNVLKTIAAVTSDVKNGTTPASSYMNNSLTVIAQNTYKGTTVPLYNAPVYLYQCDPTGRISNYVACSITNNDNMGDPLLANTGAAHFNLLRPGTYLARTNINGVQSFSQLFTVAADSPATVVTVQSQAPLYLVQTLPDAAPSSQTQTDTIVKVWDATSGKLLANFDLGALDTAYAFTTAGESLMVNIAPYGGVYTGEYALWIGTSLYASASAPGTFAAPATGALKGSQSHASATPQVVTLNTLYNCNLTTSDWYKVVLP
jgi:hypothetical protein